MIPLDTRVISLIDEGYIHGGGEKCGLLGALWLAEAGHRVDVLCAFGPVAPAFAGRPNLTMHCLEVPNIDQETNKFRGLGRQVWNQEARKSMAKLLSDADPSKTIVHAHAWMRALSSAPLDLAMDRGFRVVLTLHDYGIACPSRVFYNHRTESICTLRPLSTSCIRCECTGQSYVRKGAMLIRGFTQARVTRLAQRASGFITVGPYSEKIFRPFLRNDVPIRTVRNPSDIEPCEPATPAKNKGYVFVGRLRREKNPGFVAKATRDAGVPVTFIGDGEEREAIEASNPEATITGWVDKSEVVRHIRSARALVLASRWYECAPMVIQDAMSQGVPVLTSDACAGIEIVQEGYNGGVFRSNDEKDFVAKIRTFEDDRVVEELGRNAYETFWKGGYGQQEHTQNLKNFYAEVLASPLAGSSRRD